MMMSTTEDIWWMSTLSTPARKYVIIEMTSFFVTKNSKKPLGTFDIMIQNVQSINNKIEIIESLLKDHKYQVVCLFETWITEARRPYVHIDGYEFAATYCRREREGGGVAILLPSGTKFSNRQDLTNLTLEYVIECCAIELKPNNLLICVYRGDRQISKFFDWLTSLKLLSTLKPHHL